MKRSEAKPKKAPSEGTKLSELRGETGKFGGRFRSDAKLSAVLEARKTATARDALKRRPKATGADLNVTEYAMVLAHAVDTFGSRINANAWLNRPNRVFSNQTPLQILTKDPAAVEEELVRIDHGMFV
jgi:uncharacterized protein (DUF2384 family)